MAITAPPPRPLTFDATVTLRGRAPAAGHRARPRHRADRAQAGADRLPAGTGRVHPGQRLDRRPLRREAHLHVGHRCVPDRLARLRRQRLARRHHAARGHDWHASRGVGVKLLLQVPG